MIFMKILRKFFAFFRERKTLSYAGIYIFLLWIVASFLFYIFEPRVNDIFTAVYWAITTTTTVGYGDITPETLGGRIISIVVMLSGIGFMGVFLANFTDMLIEKSLARGMRARAYMEGHVIICGWNGIVEIALRELLADGREVAVVADVDMIPIEHRNLVFVRGEPSDDEKLSRANVAKASFVLISGKDDVETLLCAISVRKLNEKACISCVVSDPKVAQALKNIGVEQMLSTEETFGLFLSRSVFVPKLSEFLRELMATRDIDIYQERIPESFEGKSFADVMIMFKREYNAIAVGIVHDNELIINPDGERTLEGSDEILYISESKLDLKRM